MITSVRNVRQVHLVMVLTLVDHVWMGRGVGMAQESVRIVSHHASSALQTQLSVSPLVSGARVGVFSVLLATRASVWVV
jgi:hypothetical protein